MSTRYVWGKYKPEPGWKEEESQYFYAGSISSLNSYSTLGYFGKSSGEDIWTTGVFNFGTKKPAYVQHVEDVNSNTAVWAKNASDNTEYYYAQVRNSDASSGSLAKGHWYLEPGAGSNILLKAYYYSTSGASFGSAAPVVRKYRYFFIYSSDKVGNVSSSSSDAYDSSEFGMSNEAAVTGGYAYHYLGSDNIDPTEISYETAGLKPGDSVTVTVTPRGNTYGGTISYLYQFSTNGGSSWTDSGPVTTATSKSITIPAGAAQFKARVRAQDDMGFTSTDYVTGEAVTMEKLSLWVGVGGKARKGTELYVGVNGKARKAAAAYVGVNGKARRFL